MRHWMLLVVASLFSSCGLLTTSDPAVVTSIDEELQLDLWNPLDQAHALELTLSTLEPKCETSEIVTSHQQYGFDLHIAIEGLSQKAICNGEQMILQSSIPALVSAGTFQVNIDLGASISNRGVLTFDGTVYELSMESSDGLAIGNDRLFKIPPGTIWGNLSSDQNATQINTAFLAALNEIGAPVNLPSGYYGHFTVADADVQLIPVAQAVYNYPFVYTLTGQLSALQDVIDDLRASHGGTVTLECTTWSGQSL